MSDYLDQIKADAYVKLTYEYTDTGGGATFPPTDAGTVGPLDIGEEFSSWVSFIQAIHYPTPDPEPEEGEPYAGNVRTILTFENVGHILPMEWTIERTVRDIDTNDVLSTGTTTLTLVTTATFTFETSGEDTYAEFTATFKSPV